MTTPNQPQYNLKDYGHMVGETPDTVN
jgi:hypothetical protein